MQVPVCGPEPEYYNTHSFGRTVSSEWWTWRQCEMEVANQSTNSQPVEGTPFDQSFTTDVYDTNFIADNFGILSIIVILSIATVILSVYLYRSRNAVQSERNGGSLDPGDPTLWDSRPVA